MCQAMGVPRPHSGSLPLKSLAPAANTPGSGGNPVVSRCVNPAVLGTVYAPEGNIHSDTRAVNEKK